MGLSAGRLRFLFFFGPTTVTSSAPMVFPRLPSLLGDGLWQRSLRGFAPGGEAQVGKTVYERMCNQWCDPLPGHRQETGRPRPMAIIAETGA